MSEQDVGGQSELSVPSNVNLADVNILILQ